MHVAQRHERAGVLAANHRATFCAARRQWRTDAPASLPLQPYRLPRTPVQHLARQPTPLDNLTKNRTRRSIRPGLLPAHLSLEPSTTPARSLTAPSSLMYENASSPRRSRGCASIKLIPGLNRAHQVEMWKRQDARTRLCAARQRRTRQLQEVRHELDPNSSARLP